MLEKIKSKVFEKYNKSDTKWIFFSAFDKDNQLIMSNGVFYSDKSLEELIQTIYEWLIKKHTNIDKVIVDIVEENQKIEDIKEVQNISPKTHWVLLIAWNKSGIILPNTKWIDNIQTAIKTIKEKNWLQWNAEIIKFTTNRFSIPTN